MTTSLVAIPGLTVPVTVPAGVSVLVECKLPWVLMGATQGVVTLEIFEDANALNNSLRTYVANASGIQDVALSYNPIPGAHTYSAQVKSSQSATNEAGVVSGSLIVPYLRVSTC